MQYFSIDFIDFFNELAMNNHKEWFHSNKKRYEASVKKPFSNFISDLIAEVSKHETLEIEAKDCILRINRDIRFSKDKTPYNIHVTAFVSQGGRKDKSMPGLFVRLSPQIIGIMGGCFGPDKDQLAAIRNAIITDGKKLNDLIADKAFKDLFVNIKGDRMKRIPKVYIEAVANNEYVLNKQFYFSAELKPSLIHSTELMPTIMQHYHAMRPINDYLQNAIQ